MDVTGHETIYAGLPSVLPGDGSYGGDGGPALQANLYDPSSLVFSQAGELYIADAGNGRVRKVARDGIITTVAGNGATGSAGDGGPATSAQLGTPNGLAFDTGGNLYIADQTENRVRAKSPRQASSPPSPAMGSPDSAAMAALPTSPRCKHRDAWPSTAWATFISARARSAFAK